jgi:hypothetical protein
MRWHDGRLIVTAANVSQRVAARSIRLQRSVCLRRAVRMPPALTSPAALGCAALALEREGVDVLDGLEHDQRLSFDDGLDGWVQALA